VVCGSPGFSVGADGRGHVARHWITAQRERWAAADQADPAVPPAATPALAAAPGNVEDVLAQLERLGGLRDRGVLTDAEFEAQKARICQVNGVDDHGRETVRSELGHLHHDARQRRDHHYPRGVLVDGDDPHRGSAERGWHLSLERVGRPR
jgi:Short C-terminal domain